MKIYNIVMAVFHTDYSCGCDLTNTNAQQG